MTASWLAAVLNPETPQAHAIYALFLWVCAFCGVILALVTGITLYSLWRFRGRAGVIAAPSALKGSLKLEIFWTAVPVLILLGTFIVAVRVMMQSDPAPAAEARPFVVITGHQWWWEAYYPDTGVVTANEVHLPTGRPLLVELRAADVIHDFWVPELGRKMDAIPGHPNRLWMEVQSPGVYLGACAEFCGAQHAWMRTRVVGDSPETFAAWTAAQKAVPPELVTSGSAAAPMPAAAVEAAAPAATTPAAAVAAAAAVEAAAPAAAVAAAAPAATTPAAAVEAATPAAVVAAASPATTTAVDPQIAAGAALFQAKSCAACHNVAAAVNSANANAGPNLTHVGSRATLGAGVLDNSLPTMTAWLLSPESFKPASHMPNLQLTNSEASALAVYLESLQ